MYEIDLSGKAIGSRAIGSSGREMGLIDRERDVSMLPKHLNSVSEESKLAVLYKINKLVNHETASEKVFEAAVLVLSELLGCQTIAFLWLNSKGELELKKGLNFGKLNDNDLLLAKDCWKKAKPNVLKITTQKDSRNSALLKSKPKIFLPLISKQRALGVLLLTDFSDNVTLMDGDLNFLGMLADELALSIQNALLLEEIKAIALKDQLTKVYNRHYLVEKLQSELVRSKRFKHPFSILLIDIDFFKHYNDSNGHLAGDKVLREFAGVLKKNSRETDVVARYGGEEFLILLPETSKDEALKVAEKLRKKIEEAKFALEEKQPNGKLTASFGVTTFWEGQQLPDELVENADKALYLAKTSGRNQVRYFPFTTNSVNQDVPTHNASSPSSPAPLV